MQVLRVAQKIIIKEEFKVDAPFIFLLKHDLTRVSLFYGVVNEPIFNGDPKTVS
jgi:serine protease inhibitor